MVDWKLVELAQLSIEGKRKFECVEMDTVSVIVRISVLVISTFGSIGSLAGDRRHRQRWAGNRK